MTWRTRLKYAMAAAGVGWLMGWLVSFPFDLSVAWRYVDDDARRLPLALAEGLVVWGGFTLFMGMAGFLPLIPAAALGAYLLFDARMGLLHIYRFRHPEAIRAVFFSAPNFFVISFAPVVVWVYSALARRRLSAAKSVD